MQVRVVRGIGLGKGSASCAAELGGQSLKTSAVKNAAWDQVVAAAVSGL